jgi:hypothetical protein
MGLLENVKVKSSRTPLGSVALWEPEYGDIRLNEEAWKTFLDSWDHEESAILGKAYN